MVLGYITHVQVLAIHKCSLLYQNHTLFSLALASVTVTVTV